VLHFSHHEGLQRAGTIVGWLRGEEHDNDDLVDDDLVDGAAASQSRNCGLCLPDWHRNRRQRDGHLRCGTTSAKLRVLGGRHGDVHTAVHQLAIPTHLQLEHIHGADPDPR
jgi:hypothetical protein